jgi:hypothetical protein
MLRSSIVHQFPGPDSGFEGPRPFSARQPLVACDAERKREPFPRQQAWTAARAAVPPRQRPQTCTASPWPLKPACGANGPSSFRFPVSGVKGSLHQSLACYLNCAPTPASAAAAPYTARSSVADLLTCSFWRHLLPQLDTGKLAPRATTTLATRTHSSSTAPVRDRDPNGMKLGQLGQRRFSIGKVCSMPNSGYSKGKSHAQPTIPARGRAASTRAGGDPERPSTGIAARINVGRKRDRPLVCGVWRSRPARSS